MSAEPDFLEAEEFDSWLDVGMDVLDPQLRREREAFENSRWRAPERAPGLTVDARWLRDAEVAAHVLSRVGPGGLNLLEPATPFSPTGIRSLTAADQVVLDDRGELVSVSVADSAAVDLIGEILQVLAQEDLSAPAEIPKEEVLRLLSERGHEAFALLAAYREAVSRHSEVSASVLRVRSGLDELSMSKVEFDRVMANLDQLLDSESAWEVYVERHAVAYFTARAGFLDAFEEELLQVYEASQERSRAEQVAEFSDEVKSLVESFPPPPGVRPVRAARRSVPELHDAACTCVVCLG